jgi:hypothetical protein
MAFARLIAETLPLTLEPGAPASPQDVPLRRGANVEILEEKDRYVRVRVVGTMSRVEGWLERRFLDLGDARTVPRTGAANARMWQLAQWAIGQRIGWRLGAKRSAMLHEGVIDCSGWVAWLLAEGFAAENTAMVHQPGAPAPAVIFDKADLAAIDTYSDAIVGNVARLTGFLLEGLAIAGANLSPGMVIGLNAGEYGWESSAPRSRGIDHVVIVLRNPVGNGGGPLYICQSAAGHGVAPAGGVSLMPLATWMEQVAKLALAGRLFAVDPMRLADPFALPT